jgi:hypothetical protein
MKKKIRLSLQDDDSSDKVPFVAPIFRLNGICWSSQDCVCSLQALALIGLSYPLWPTSPPPPPSCVTCLCPNLAWRQPYPGGGDSVFLQSVFNHLPDCMVSYLQTMKILMQLTWHIPFGIMILGQCCGCGPNFESLVMSQCHSGGYRSVSFLWLCICFCLFHCRARWFCPWPKTHQHDYWSMLLGVTLGFQTIQGRHLVASDLAQNGIHCVSSYHSISVYRVSFQRCFKLPVLRCK